MQTRNTSWPVLMTGAAALTMALLTTAPDAKAASPFEALQGSWSGGGSIQFDSGQSERLRCNAYYTSSGGGAQLGLAIRCASPSNKIEIRGRLSYQGGSVSGTWEERTFNASGTASGSATDNRVSLRLAGAFPGAMNVALSRSRQSVSISTQGSGVRAVRIGLSRR